MPIQSAILPLRLDLDTGILLGAPLEIPKGFLHQIELVTIQGGSETLLPIGSSLSLKILSPADGTVLENITVWNRNTVRNIYEASLDTVSGVLAVVGSPVIKARADWTPTGGDPQVGRIVHVNYVRGMKTIGDTVPDFLLKLAENIRFSWKQLRDRPETGNADNVAVTPFTGVTADRVQDALVQIFAAALAADNKAQGRVLKDMTNADNESVLDRHLSALIKAQLAARDAIIVGQWDPTDEVWPVDTTGDMSPYTPNMSSWATQETHEWGGVTYPKGGRITWNGGTSVTQAENWTHVPPSAFNVGLIPLGTLLADMLASEVILRLLEEFPDVSGWGVVDVEGRLSVRVEDDGAFRVFKKLISDVLDYTGDGLSIRGNKLFSSEVFAGSIGPNNEIHYGWDAVNKQFIVGNFAEFCARVAALIGVSEEETEFAQGRIQIFLGEPVVSDYVVASAAMSIPTTAIGRDEASAAITDTGIVHPTVLKMKPTWRGKKYWMSYTPYPGSDSQYENPHIFWSDDGITFEEPTGISNPIQLPPDTGYWADPDLRLGPDGALYCFYIKGGGGTPLRQIFVQKSYNGVDWTDQQSILDSVVENPVGYVVSPSMVYDNGWHIFLLTFADPWAEDLNYNGPDGGSAPPYTLKRLYSQSFASSLSMDDAQNIVIADPPWDAGTKEPWHLEVTKIDDVWIMVVSTTTHGTSGSSSALWLGVSPDGWNWSFHPDALAGRANAYRSSLVVESVEGRDEAGSYTLNCTLYYGAQSGWQVFRDTLKLKI